jgi:lipopolysaccharide export system protein LptA
MKFPHLAKPAARTAALAAALMVATGGVLTLAAPAQAQLAGGSDAPVDITADELEVINSQCLAIWRGSAEALQDSSRLRANTLRIRYVTGRPARAGAEPSCGDLDRMEAEGEVYYVTPQQRVRSNAAVYEAASETITMTGDVVAAQGQNVLRGQRLVINVATGEARMETSARGAGATGRVRGVFYPNASQGQPAAKR